MIGNIPVPAPPAPTLTFPLRPDYGSGRAYAPEVAIHTFGSANAKIEQRYDLGAGQAAFHVVCSDMGETARKKLRDFWEARKGPWEPFYYDDPGDGTRYTVRFANEPLSWEMLAAGVSSTGLTLIGVPSAPPTYALNQTLSRFPNAALANALLDQVQRMIPLVKIQPREPGYPAIYVSDRRCTVGSQAYEPRLLRRSEITQTLRGVPGESEEADSATFVFGNADAVMRQLADDTNLYGARIEFSLFHTGTGIKLDYWAGEIESFSGETSEEFTVTATDGLADMRALYPQDTITRECRKKFNDGNLCPYTSEGNGGGHTECDKTLQSCIARGMSHRHGGIALDPQTIGIKDNSTGFRGLARNLITPTSLVEDNALGTVLQEIYTDTAMPVPCKIMAVRDEGEFFGALGIVGAGPIGAYDPDPQKFLLDDQAPHGPGMLGLRRSHGSDPVQNNDPDPASDKFSMWDASNNYGPERAAGVAFVEIKRTDAKGIQPSRAADHKMSVPVVSGVKGWHWSAPGARALGAITSPAWLMVNAWLKVKGLWHAPITEQEKVFDVDAAIAAGAICSTPVDKLIGTGTETQFLWRGRIDQQRALSSWFASICQDYLGYYVSSFGRLKVGIRVNSSTVSAYTAGNMILDSLQLEPLAPQWWRASASYANAERNWANDVLPFRHEAYAELMASSAGFPQYKDGNLNLAGTSTPSQAARILITTTREQLGGNNPTEWRRARRGAWKTTILGLENEVGHVVSATHEDVPGGHGEFRVTRQTLHADYSVTLEVRTTTDSMYDYAIGPKPADVTASPVPVEPVDLVPGDVQPIGVEPFLVTVTEDGTTAVVDVEYDPPATIGVFFGVAPTVESATGERSARPDGDYNGDATAAAGTPARRGTLRFEIAQPTAADEQFKIWLPSRSRAYRRPITASTPNVTVTIHQATSGSGIPVLPEVSSPSISVPTFIEESGVLKAEYTITCTAPSPLNGFEGTDNVSVDQADGAHYVHGHTLLYSGAAGGTYSFTLRYDVHAVQQVYDLYLRSAGQNGTYNALVLKDQPSPTPYVTVTVPALSAVPVPDVAAFDAGEPSGPSGARVWLPQFRWEPQLRSKMLLSWGVKKPESMVNFSGFAMWVEAPGFSPQQCTGVIPASVFDTTEYVYPEDIEFNTSDLPAVPEQWTMRVVSYNIVGEPDGGAATPQGPALTFTTLAPDAVSFATPAAPTITLGWYRYADDGSLELVIDWTANDAITAGVHAYVEPYDQSTDSTAELGTWTLGTDALLGDWKPIDCGKFTDSTVVISGLSPVRATTSIRVSLSPYSDQVDVPLVRAGQAGETPSTVLVVDPPEKSSRGREWAEPVENFLAVAVPMSDVAVARTRLVCTFTKPSYRPPRGIWVYIEWPGMDAPVPLGICTDSGQEVELETPTRIVTAKVWGVSFVDPADTPDPADDHVCTIVPGVTPMVEVQIGTSTGTVDLGEALTSSIASHLEVASGVLGVKASGITEALIANAAVTTQKLVDEAVGTNKIAPFATTAAKIADAAIQNAHLDRATAKKIAIVDADVANLSAAKLNAGSIAASIAYLGTVNASQVNAGTFSGCALVLDLNGVTTKVTNVAIGSSIAGLSVKDNSSQWEAHMMAGGVTVTAPGSVGGTFGMIQFTGGGGPISYLMLHRINHIGDTASFANIGAASPPPAAPAGYMIIDIAGAKKKIPYYNE